MNKGMEIANNACRRRPTAAFKFALCAAAIAAFAAASAPFVFPPSAHAQTSDSTSLTITPPFFTINVSPGDTWSSSIRVVNTMGVNLPVSATVMGFRPSDDKGHGTFIGQSGLSGDPDALANWISLPSPTVSIAPDSAADVPFSISVPRNASPGGHYAAVLIGTQPPGGSGIAGSHIGISSYISALIFVTVSGDIKEEGSIRQFSTDKRFYQNPNVGFSVLFANEGNVHVRPVGEIQIYNMFGREVGTVPVNNDGNFGYVLPSSTREFDEQWQGAGDLLNIGQFTAVLSLAYGTNGTKSASATLVFWVLPIWKLVTDGVILLLIVGGFIFLLRLYVRRMLSREMGRYGPRVIGPPMPPGSGSCRKTIEKSGQNDTVDLRR